MKIDPIKHYAVTAHPSVYDEEAMTALELAGRTAAKVNECIDTLDKEITRQDGVIKDGLDSIPGKIENEVESKVADGTFEDIIDKYEDNLKERIDNLETNYTPGSTTADAELIDVRLGADGTTEATAGASVRAQIKKIKRGHVDYMTSVNLLDSENDITVGQYLSNGELKFNAEYATSEFIPVEPGSVLWYSMGIRFIAYYDANYNYKTTTTKEADTTIRELVGDGIRYIRVSWKTAADYVDELSITKGVRRLGYQPYKAVINPKNLPDGVIIGDVTPDRLSIMSSDNLYNPNKAVSGFYMGLDGWCYESDDYCYSDIIRVTPGEKIHFTPNARFITAFDLGLEPVMESGAQNYKTYTVPEDIHYIVATFPADDFDEIMINRGDVPLSYKPYRQTIDPKYIDLGNTTFTPDEAKLEQAHSTVRANGIVRTSFSISKLGERTIPGLPNYSKRGQKIIFNGWTSAFRREDCFTIWIGDDYVRFVHNSGLGESISIKTDKEGNQTLISGTNVLNLGASFIITILNTGKKLRVEFMERGGNTNIVEQDSIGYFCGPIKIQNNAEGTIGGVFTVCNSDLNKPVWIFGDSYTNFKSERVLKWLDDNGINNYYVSALAGATSAIMYEDLQKALVVHTPKYLLWLTGMNDSDEDYCKYVDKVLALCREKGIDPVFAVVPNIPGKNHTAKHNYLASLNVRRIYWRDAVSSSTSGAWSYNTLSGDNVHPNAHGAELLSKQILLDFPEIACY